ncbi:MAG: hypothetical protein EOP49_06605, partial [Sphingobacteriales bacterium]
MNFVSDYSSILVNAAKNGKIDPHRAAELIENQTGIPKYSTQIFFECVCDSCLIETKKKIDGKLFFMNLEPDKEEEINKNRRMLGLENIVDYTKKTLFDLKDDRFMLFYLGGIPTFSFDTDEDALSFI